MTGALRPARPPCVKWSLKVPRLTPSPSPAISILEFYPDFRLLIPALHVVVMANRSLPPRRKYLPGRDPIVLIGVVVNKGHRAADKKFVRSVHWEQRAQLAAPVIPPCHLGGAHARARPQSNR